jgi:uncharacterized integral membrane protein
VVSSQKFRQPPIFIKFSLKNTLASINKNLHIGHIAIEKDMSFKTTVAIIITIGLTVLIMQNSDEAVFTIFFTDVKLPKLVILTAVSVSAFLLGVIVSRPGRPKQQAPYEDYDDEENGENNRPGRRPDTLSDEDREYIS